MIEYFYNIVSMEGGRSHFSAWIELTPDNPIYAAHFPGHPVTPGACQLEMVRSVASLAVGRDLEIASVKNLKFLSAVNPLETGTVLIEGEMDGEDSGPLRCSASIAGDETVFTKLSMTFRQ